jgi:hypothetical protein
VRKLSKKQGVELVQIGCNDAPQRVALGTLSHLLQRSERSAVPISLELDKANVRKSEVHL